MNISKNTFKIIEFLLRHIYENGFNVNQIARELEISVGRAHEILQSLKTEKIVNVLDLKSSIYYFLNLNNPDTIDMCKLILREEKRALNSTAKIYAEEIEKFKNAKFIILFGSVLIKKEFNDVDVLFITGSVKEVNMFCMEISKIRTKPINPLIMTYSDFVNNLKSKNKVILELVNKGIILMGEDKFLEALKNAG